MSAAPLPASSFREHHPQGARWLVPAALLGVYVVWGSTYLALRFVVEELPALLSMSIRFGAAGTVLYWWARRRGRPAPTRAEWWGAARVGVLLLAGGVGLVAIGEQLGVGSGLAATAVAVMPVWAAMWAGVFGLWPTRREWAGLAVGLIGVVILSGEGDFAGNVAGAALVIVAPILWSFGSVLSTRATMPQGMMSAAAQMLCVAPFLWIAGWARGERFDGTGRLSGWIALAYLILFGSIVAYSAYIYLLQNVRPALATSYAYVNPVVAVVLGITLGGEELSGQAYIALPMILGGVALVAVANSRTARVARTAAARLGGGEHAR